MQSVSLSKLVLVGGLVIAAGALAACGDDGTADQAGAAPPPSVTVVPVTRQDFSQSEEFVGKTEAFHTVDIRARATGFLQKKGFSEGEDVAQDALLYEIDPAEYNAAVASATAGVERAKATFTEADQKLGRTKTLAEKGTLSTANLDEAVSAQARAKADMSAAEADLENAQLNLSYTQIRSPITGRIGASAVDVGNLIGPDSGVLATVIDLDPMRVAFSLSERMFLNVTEMMSSGNLPDFTPRIRLANDNIYDQDGTLAFADNQVDSSTGTVRVFVDFPNPDNVLVPGLFVHVILTSSEPEQEIMVPQIAVQLNQSGSFVLVVGDDNLVEIRQITTGARAGANIVVDQGLSEGEQIIIDGIQKVRPGGEVTVVVASNADAG